MRDEYDFSDAVKHPLAGKFKGKYTVTVHYDFTEKDEPKRCEPKEAESLQVNNTATR